MRHGIKYVRIRVFTDPHIFPYKDKIVDFVFIQVSENPRIFYVVRGKPSLNRNGRSTSLYLFDRV